MNKMDFEFLLHLDEAYGLRDESDSFLASSPLPLHPLEALNSLVAECVNGSSSCLMDIPSTFFWCTSPLVVDPGTGYDWFICGSTNFPCKSHEVAVSYAWTEEPVHKAFTISIVGQTFEQAPIQAPSVPVAVANGKITIDPFSSSFYSSSSCFAISGSNSFSFSDASWVLLNSLASDACAEVVGVSGGDASFMNSALSLVEQGFTSHPLFTLSDGAIILYNVNLSNLAFKASLCLILS